MMISRHAIYTLIWNALDYPSCAFPVTEVIPDVDVAEHRDIFFSDDDKATYNLCESSQQFDLSTPEYSQKTILKHSLGRRSAYNS